MSSAIQQKIEERLDAKFRRDSGGARRVTEFGVLEEGHAGLTFAFSLIDAETGNNRTDYVLKVAPFGVVRKGNTDVYRQAPLLWALRNADMPVPGVPFASPGEDDLGTPYIVMERLPGRSFVPWSPHPSFDRSSATVDAIWRQTVAALARIHRFDWRKGLGEWEMPRALEREAAYWTPLLDKAQRPETRDLGRRLADRLAATIPQTYRLGLVHGDYQPGNILFDRGELTGIIDWELASIGAQALDLGWLAMLVDGRCWADGWRPVSTLGPEDVHDIYADAIGFAVPDMHWYQALACFRLGAITCLNLRLHRSGKRVDPIWENFALGVDIMFDRGLELIGAVATTPTKRAIGQALGN